MDQVTYEANNGDIPGGLYCRCNANADAGSQPVGKSIAAFTNDKKNVRELNLKTKAFLNWSIWEIDQFQIQD